MGETWHMGCERRLSRQKYVFSFTPRNRGFVEKKGEENPGKINILNGKWFSFSIGWFFGSMLIFRLLHGIWSGLLRLWFPHPWKTNDNNNSNDNHINKQQKQSQQSYPYPQHSSMVHPLNIQFHQIHSPHISLPKNKHRNHTRKIPGSFMALVVAWVS